MVVVKVSSRSDLASHNLIVDKLSEIYSKESLLPFDIRLLDFEQVFFDLNNLESSGKGVYNQSFEVFEKSFKNIFLIEKMLISYWISRAFFDFSQNKGLEPCLVIFDSHFDCSNAGKSKVWLKRLIEDGFPLQNILLVGIRNVSKEALVYLKEKQIRIVSLDRFTESLEDVSDMIMEFSQGKSLYVSLNMDLIDPAYAPGVDRPEPGGLTSREIIYLSKRISKMRNLRGVGIGGLNLVNDLNGVSVKLGARILAELI